MSSSTQLVEKVSGVLAARISRRGFFARSAVVGSAIAANPVTYALTPTDAYAAVCSCSGSSCQCGSTCCDGYTEFCCTLSGHNQCPRGSILGGWWKVDGSGFCSGARYYVDCNAPCNGCGCGGGGICSGSCSGTNCGCALGDCNNRKAGCTNFRYGQCNQQTACIGPILCRVVTCVAPWEIDATCTTTARYDAATAFHDRPCLHATVGKLDSAEEVGGGVRAIGWAFDWDTNQPITVRFTVDGQAAGSTTANVSRSDVGYFFPGQRPGHGFDTVVSVAGGTHTVCATAVNTGPGADTMIGCVTTVSSSPFGALDVLTVGRGSINVAGWAIDPDTNDPIAVHVYIGTQGVALNADQARPDVDAAFGKGANHGFSANLPTPGGRQQIAVYAINSGAGGNVLLAAREIETGAPFGDVEHIDPAPGGVRVRGWAIDPDVDGPIQVHLYAVGRGTPVLADRPRPDLTARFGEAGPAHGFDVVIPAPPGRNGLAVYAINDAGPNKLIADRPIDVLSGSPFGFVDVVEAGPGFVHVAGWVLDPDSSGSVDVHAYVGATGTALRADIPRPDIDAAFPGYGAVHGFDARIPVPSGFHQVCLYGINVGPGDNQLLGCRMVLVGGDPFGTLDVAEVQGGQLTVAGWAIDPDTADPIDVHVYVSGSGRAFTADGDRPDVGAAFPDYGARHGFGATFAIPGGQQQVCVYAIDKGLGENRLLACRTVGG